VFLKTRRHSQLLSLAQAVLVESQSDNAVWNKLTVSLTQLAQTNAAIHFTLKTVRLFPENAVNYYNLGQLYYQIEQVDLAAPWLRKAALLRPNYDSLTTNLASVLAARQIMLLLMGSVAGRCFVTRN
jgi:Flp pilus assembly protein TadD